MCATCGCSDGATARVIDPSAPAAIPVPGHDPGHDQAGGHRHDHGHDDEHGHEHGHGHEHTDADRTVLLEQRVLARNDMLAERNRRFFADRSIRAVNLMSSPGSGKTTLLERTIRDLGPAAGVSVIEGDQETTFDADRIRATGCRVVQVNTGAGCHLDAEMVATAARTLDPPHDSTVFIENVGNLVCPALFDLGEHVRVVLMSTTEGADKPVKYPHMFRTADLVLLNKVDLLPYLDITVAEVESHLATVNPRPRVLPISATRGDGLAGWYAWLRDQS